MRQVQRNLLILSHLLERVILPEALRTAGREAPSKAQYEMLLYVANHPGVRPAELARAMGVSAPTVTTSLQRLTRHGWVEKAPTAQDLRGVTVHLTASGRHLLAQVEQEHRNLLAALLAEMPVQPREQLAEGLEALLEAATRLSDHSLLCLQCGDAHSSRCVLARQRS